MKIPFLKYRKIYYLFSALLIAGSIYAIFSYGLRFGMEFTGGSVMEISVPESGYSRDEVINKLKSLDFPEITVSELGNGNISLRLPSLSDENYKKILEALPEAKEERFETIGPVIGEELKKKTQTAIALSLLAIMLYIAFAFRKLTYPAKPWQYGIAALVALFHDLIIPLGVFAALGKFYNVEITIPFVAALLTVLGYSISDTVVVYDRIRENYPKNKERSFYEVVEECLNQTIGRSITTNIAAVLTLVSIFFFGGETLKYFALAMIIGIISGSYSSIFIATPLLVIWSNPNIDKSKK